MKQLTFVNSKYSTSSQKVSFFSKFIPSVSFYSRFFSIVCISALRAKNGKYGDVEWNDSSNDVLRALERVGVKIEVEGIENVEQLDGPCVFIGNHMSMMETMLIPAMIRPLLKITYVIKESLLHYPVFKHVMRSRNPIAVTRTNPRQDLKTVMNEGVERLNKGISVIVFPQTTRSHTFDPDQMSTIGVKLAKKAGVPVVPVALKTDAWTNGKRLKDFGRIDVTKATCFAFGKPMTVESKGGDEQKIINDFIVEKLRTWRD